MLDSAAMYSRQSKHFAAPCRAPRVRSIALLLLLRR